MKIRITAATVLLGLMGSVANAAPVTMADVVALDPLVIGSAADLPNSGSATEVAWARAASGNNALVEIGRLTTPGDGNWLPIESTSSSFALDLGAFGASTLYFGVKTANNSGNQHWLFTNVNNLSWAAFDASVISAICTLRDCNSGRISHITLFGVRSVPEPATLGLLGLGLAGLGFARRRRTA